jgi:hypothetical protein
LMVRRGVESVGARGEVGVWSSWVAVSGRE